jgi:class 3 adenylate cyclase
MNRIITGSFYIFLVFNSVIGFGNSQSVNSLYKKPTKATDSTILEKLDLYDRNYESSKDSAILGEKILMEIVKSAQSKNDYNGLLMSFYRLGKSEHVWKKDDVKAVKYFFESLKYAELKGNQEYISKSYNYLGIIFYTNHKYDDAIKYFKTAIESRWNGEQSFRSIPFYLCGLSYYELHQYDTAMNYFTSALELVKKTGDQEREHEIEQGIAKVLIALNQNRKAEVLIAKTLRFYQETNETVAMAVAYNLFSKISFSENRLEEALGYSLMAYAHSNNSNDIPTHKIDIAQLLHDIYFKMGNVQEAHRYLLEVQRLKDAATSLDITSQIALTYAKYRNEIERKQLNETITKQKRENRMALIAAGVLGGLFLIIGLLLVFVRKERQKSEALIHNILPAETVEQLKSFGKAIPIRHDSVTVMFCDVKGFSELATILEPETLINLLDFYFSKFDSIISTYTDIEKIKTIGDAYLCVSGLHNSQNHAVSLVSAAYELIQFVNDSKALAKERFGYAIEFRVGIHSGSLVSGVVGTHKYAYDVWGDTVNIAARMEGSSVPGKINISQATYDYVKDHFNFEYRGVIEVKNGLQLEMYFVVDKLS